MAMAAIRKTAGGITRSSRERMVYDLLEQIKKKGAASVSARNWNFVQATVASDPDLSRFVAEARFPKRTAARARLERLTKGGVL